MLVCLLSSNGKSVTWAQNERSYRPNLWKRISIHVKKKEEVEVNQTAIIKPFSKGADTSLDTEVKPEYDEEPQVSEPYTAVSYPPCSPSQSPLLTVSQQAEKARSLPGREDGEETQALSTYTPELSQHVGCAAVSRRGTDNGRGVTVNMANAEDISGIGVGDIGSQPQGTIMDQISSVVSRFTANISELNTMMLPGGATTGTSSLPPGSDNSSCTAQYLTPRGRQAPSTVTTYAEVSVVSNYCENRQLGGMYDHGACVSSRRPKDMEELIALTPPSPFRDSSLDSNSNSPPSMSPGSEAEYDLLLRQYSQSSSSL